MGIPYSRAYNNDISKEIQKIEENISRDQKNNDLLKKLGEQNMYIKLLKKEFEKRKIKTPTMKELMEYEITHKSPYQLKKEGKIDV